MFGFCFKRPFFLLRRTPVAGKVSSGPAGWERAVSSEARGLRPSREQMGTLGTCLFSPQPGPGPRGQGLGPLCGRRAGGRGLSRARGGAAGLARPARPARWAFAPVFVRCSQQGKRRLARRPGVGTALAGPAWWPRLRERRGWVPGAWREPLLSWGVFGVACCSLCL